MRQPVQLARFEKYRVRAATVVQDLYYLQCDRFFSYWTLKESYIKARGIGLSIPLDRFSFSISEQSGIDVSFTSPIEDRAENWQFTQFWPSRDNIAALCTERVVEVRRDAEIGIRETVPLHGNKLERCK